jgi:long-chain acyl-CoA synthetase
MEISHEAEFAKFLTEDPHLAVMMKNRVKKYGDNVAARQRVTGEWESITWNTIGKQIDLVSKALLEWDTAEHEMVGIFSQNRAEWSITDLGILAIRGVSVPIYATNSKEETEYIIDEAEIRILFVNDAEQYEKAMAVKAESKFLKKIIVFDPGVKLADDGSGIYFHDFLELGAKSDKGAEAERRLKAADSDDLCTLIYTSGTTGAPKGAMLTHRGFLYSIYAVRFALPWNEKDVSLCFLPLSHVFERAWSYAMFYGGAQNNFCHDTKQLLDFLKEVKPTYMAIVPRMWEKINSTITEGLKDAPETKKKLFNWSVSVGAEYYPRKFKKLPIPVSVRFKHFFAFILVLKKVQAVAGAERHKLFINGGAPFNPGINRFFESVGIAVSLGYGITEIFPIATPTRENYKYGTSGPLIPLMQFKLSEFGEILVKAHNRMIGYYKKPEETAKALTEDGWFMTGDIGHIDEDGHVVITDRIKELIITSGGKNISPILVETMLKMNFYIEQAVAIGDGKNFISALIVPSFPALEGWAAKKGITFKSHEDLIKNPEVIKLYEEIVEEQNKPLGQVERVKKFTLLPEELSQEKGELTPTGKLKRRVVNNSYKLKIEEMYTN